MKPIYLEMYAFGPYADKQALDFRLLGKRQLFLIYGPTGSGKTTILDAICYALYGDTSGNARSGKDMRSKYADDKKETKVIFTFSAGRKVYRIERRPEQEIAKKRGTGMRSVSMKAELYEIQGDSETLLASRNVTQEVERILGFKSDQFRQVVLLPQGDFRKLLLASSGERQKIMQVLFHTQRYAKLQELAKTMHDDINEAYRELAQKAEQYLRIAGAEDEKVLQQAVAAKRVAVQAKEEAAAAVLSSRDNAQQQLQRSQVLASHWQALQEAKKHMNELLAQQEHIEGRRHLLDKLKKAQLLQEPFRTLDTIQQQGTEASKQYRELQKKEMAAASVLQQVAQKEEELAEERPDYEKKRAEIVQLATLRKDAAAYAALQDNERRAAAETGEKEKSWQQAQTALQKAQRILQEAQQTSAAQTGIEGEYEKAKALTIRYQERLKQEEEIEELAKSLQELQTKTGQVKKVLHKATIKANQDKTDYNAVHEQFLQGQAFVLAATLSDAEPCPVCGSVQHPCLAVKPADFPEKADVERCRLRAEKSEKIRQQTALTLQGIEVEEQEKHHRYENLRCQYPAAGTTAEWRTKTTAAAADEEKCRIKVEAARSVTQRLSAWQKDVDEKTAGEEQARRALESARFQAVQCKAALSQAEKNLPAAYRQPDVLEKTIARLQREQDNFEAREKRLQKERQEQEQAKAHWSGQAKVKAEQRDSLRCQFRSALSDLKTQAEQYGFTDMEECRDLQKKISKLASVEEEIKTYEAAWQQVQGQIAQEEKVTNGTAIPDIQAEKENLNALNRNCQILSKEAAALQAQLEQLKQCTDEIGKLRQEQELLSERYKTVGALYDLVSGKTTGINFERYVLGALLDEVLQAANQRLSQMSRNRYELQRSRSWDDRRVRQIGLDIEVFDAYTGYARPANTLSGGETFLASLSLALGLADVVQAYSGGIHLDTIFIDEGFGTLDSETLDFALKVLLELRQGGRLVGIISHVGELQERIDTRLAVRKTDRGSVAAFEIL